MTSTTIDDVQAREARYVLQTYRRQPITFVRGERVFACIDSEGREYLDLLSGIGVASLGHAHPGLAEAIADQARTLLHTSNLFFHPLQGQTGGAPRCISPDCPGRSSATAEPKRWKHV